MASELSTQVYTAPQAPDYLGHYANLVKSIPNAGLQFLAAQQAAAQNQKAQAEYAILNQKAKQFMELYPAFKASQIAEYDAKRRLLDAKVGQIPYQNELLAARAKYQTGHARMFDQPEPGAPTGFEGVEAALLALGGGKKPVPDPMPPGSTATDTAPTGEAIVPPKRAVPPVFSLRGSDEFTLPALPEE